MIDVSVVTPSFNMLGYLKRCCASVADQEGAAVEHIVVDAVSTDGTAAWLRENARVRPVIEKDRGMYDAVNKGFCAARGRLLAYLNCDEQYLPGTLRYVTHCFERHPQVDLLFGDALLVRPDGTLISYRKAYPPRWYYILSSHLYALSCAMFLRRRVVEDGFRFDDRLRDVGDQDFVARVLRAGYRARHVGRYLAAFTVTGTNMSGGENALREWRRALATAPRWVRTLRRPLNALRLAEKWRSGAYRQGMPLRYALYDGRPDRGRSVFEVHRGSFRWPPSRTC
jgi:glycosyltransferase involved in cell wall biosynthesis